MTLDRQTKKDQWIGYDNESNRSQIYFLDTSTVRIEQIFHFVRTSHSRLEGEQVPISKF